MAIRGALESDLGAILDIYNDAVVNTTATFDLAPRTAQSQTEWFAEHAHPYVVIVCEDEGRVVGWGSLNEYRSRPAYRFTAEASVYVHPAVRRRGVGEALLRELIGLGAQNGFHTLVGLITEENEASVRLAEKTGFRRTGTLEEVGFKFDRWLNVTVYQHGLGS